MTSLDYEDVFNSFLGNITDHKLLTLDESDISELLIEYLHKSISQAYVFSLFNDVELDDDSEVISYELKYEINESLDKEFLTYVLGKAMVLEWITPQVQSTLNTMQGYFGKEQKYYSQANHLSELRGLKEDIDLEIRRRIRDRGSFNNSYLGGSRNGI